MEIRRYPSALLSSNMYLIVEDGAAVVIDPSNDISAAEHLKIEKIILTHEHYDHISGVNLWEEQTHARVLCSKSCALNIQDPKKNLARIFDVFCELQTWIKLDRLPETDPSFTCTADESFEDETSFSWRGHRFFLFEIPGHSQGSIGILLDEKYFFSGDSLMKDKEIELRFPGGSKKLWETVGRPRLLKINDGITVYPGHFEEYILKR